VSKSFVRVLSVLAVLGTLVGTAEATPINPLGGNDLSGFTTNNSGNWGRGWRFTANASDINVVELGAWAPTVGTTYDLVLWDTLTSSAIASTSITAADNWVYSAVSPVTLINGRDYIVELYNAEGPSQYYYYNGVGPGPWEPTGDISYVNMTFCNDCNSGDLPTDILTDYQYGVPDIGYVRGAITSVPEPVTVSIFGAGLAGAVALRRRRKARKA
jgi:hypothetical protein